MHSAFIQHNRQSSEGRMNIAPDIICNVTDDPVDEHDIEYHPSDHCDIPSEQDKCNSPHIQSISPNPSKKSVHKYTTPKSFGFPCGQEVAEETQGGNITDDVAQTPSGCCPSDYDSDNYDDYEVIFDPDTLRLDLSCSKDTECCKKATDASTCKLTQPQYNNQGERVDNLYIVDMLNRQNQDNQKQIEQQFDQFDKNYAIKLSSFQGQIDGIDQKMDGIANAMDHKMDGIFNTMNQKMEQLSISQDRIYGKKRRKFIFMLISMVSVIFCCLFIGCFLFCGQYKDDHVDESLMQHSQRMDAMEYQSNALLSIIQEQSEMIQGLNASLSVALSASQKQIMDNINTMKSEIYHHQNQNVRQLIDGLQVMNENMMNRVNDLHFLVAFFITISIIIRISYWQLFTSNVSKPIQPQQPAATYSHPQTLFTQRRFKFSQIDDVVLNANLDIHHHVHIDDVQSSPSPEFEPLLKCLPYHSSSDSFSSLSPSSSSCSLPSLCLSSSSFSSSCSSSPLLSPISAALNGPIPAKETWFCFGVANSALTPYQPHYKVKTVPNKTESQKSSNPPSSNQPGSNQSGSQQGNDGSNPPNDSNNNNSGGFNGGSSGNRGDGDDGNNDKNNRNKKPSDNSKKNKTKKKKKKKEQETEETEETEENEDNDIDQDIEQIPLKESKSAPNLCTIKLNPKKSTLNFDATPFVPSSASSPTPITPSGSARTRHGRARSLSPKLKDRIPATIIEVTPDGSDIDSDVEYHIPLIPTPETPVFHGPVAPTDDTMTDKGEKYVPSPDPPPPTSSSSSLLLLNDVLTPQQFELQVVDEPNQAKPAKKGKKKSKKKNNQRKKQRKQERAKMTGYISIGNGAEGNIERPTQFIREIADRVQGSFVDPNHFLDSYTAFAHIHEGHPSKYTLNDGNMKMYDFGFREKGSNKKLLCLASKSQRRGQKWKFVRLMTKGDICDEYEMKEQDLPQSVPDILQKRFRNKKMHELKIKEWIMDDTKFNALITKKSTKWQDDDIVHIHYKEDTKRSMELSMIRGQFIDELKQIDRRQIDLVSIPMFKGQKYRLEFVWIVKIDREKSNSSIGISFRYDEKTDNVIITDIHCNKQMLQKQHELVSWEGEAKCDALDTFDSNFDRIKIYGNPDERYYKPKCKVYEEFIKSYINASANKFESFGENGRKILNQPFHFSFDKHHRMLSQ